MMRGVVRSVMMAAALIGGSFTVGCAVVEEVHTSLFDTSKTNLTDSTYAAADMLAQQTRARMGLQTPLKIAVLTDVTTPNEVTAFGQQVANQLGSRFVQLGYNVQSVPLPPGMWELNPGSGDGAPVSLTGATTSAAPKPIQTGGAPMPVRGGEAIITGTYTRMKNTMLVSLKVVQLPDRAVIAAYDYSMKMTRDLDEISISAAEQVEEESVFNLFGGSGVEDGNKPQ